MPFPVRGLVLFTCAVALHAQTQAPQQRPGLEADWDIGAVIQGIGEHAAGMLPLLERVDAKSWVSKGASETYLVQLQSTKDQARAILEGSKTLSRHPEQLSTSLEMYFRMQGIETMVGSLAEGIRKYQTPAQAQELLTMAALNGTNRDRLQKYLVNLAAERERDLQVMDREAQRCRAILTEPAPPKPGKKR
jgi:hypothetical protein